MPPQSGFLRTWWLSAQQLFESLGAAGMLWFLKARTLEKLSPAEKQLECESHAGGLAAGVAVELGSSTYTSRGPNRRPGS